AAIDSVLREERVFPPPPEFSCHAHVPDRTRYDALYRWSVDDPEGFWREMAGRLRWMAPFKRVLDWQPPFAKWFVGGRLNIADNCLDRHLSGPRRNKAALVWEGEPGERRVLTYHALHRDGCRPRSLVARAGRRRLGRLPRRPARQRAPALHPLHERHDRKAEGRRAHDRWLPPARRGQLRVGLRPEGPGHLLVHRRHRLGDGPQLRRLRAARERR